MTLATPSPVLACVDLQVRRGAASVLQPTSLRFFSGQWVSVVGPNGAGKSTLLLALAGLLPHGGQVQLQGKPLAQWPGRRRAQRLAWMGQGAVFDEHMNVWDVAMLGRLHHRPLWASATAADHQAVQSALSTTGAWAWRQRRMGQLSGGEQQRVLLARLLATEAEVLLMDEPLAHLDVPHQVEWLAWVRALTQKGRTVISVLHEVGMALQADHLLVMCQGQVLHAGACHEMRTHQALERVFEQRVQVHSLDGQWVVLPRHISPHAP